MRDTPCAREIRRASDASGQTIERLYVKHHAREEIRFSWWNNGKLVIRPLDLPESELLPLMRAAIAEGVFSRSFLVGLDETLNHHLRRGEAEAAGESEQLGNSSDVLSPFDDSGDRRRTRMTLDEMLALGDALVALPLLDRRTPDAIIDDPASP